MKILPKYIQQHRNWLSFWKFISLLVIIHLGVFSLRIITSDENLRIQYIPDDAYYYLTLARNFTLYHTWTFDSGHSLTSGFHPFLAYILVLIYFVTEPTTDTFILYGLILSLFTTSVAVFIGWSIGLGRKSSSYLACFSLIISGQSFAQNTISIMEWPLILLLTILYTLTFVYISSQSSRSLLLFMLGLGGSFARSDFGLLTLCLFFISLVRHFFLKRKEDVISAFAGLIGATLGVIIVLVHNFLFTGNFLQASARMKAFWATIHTNTSTAALSLIPHALGIEFVPFHLLAMQFGLAILTGGLLVLKRHALSKLWLNVRDNSQEQDRALIVLAAAPLVVVGYIVFYMRNGGLQQWYTANLIIPLFFIVVYTAKYTGEFFSRNKILKLLGSVMLLLIIGRNIAFIHLGTTAPWPHQQSMMIAGKYLSHHSFNGHIGAWNAGIIGYYQGGRIVNLDGLVNDAVYPYVVNNNLSLYLSQEKIRYIVDFKSMLDSKEYRLRGGYDDPEFLHRLCPVKQFDAGQYDWKRMTLYRVIPDTIMDGASIYCH